MKKHGKNTLVFDKTVFYPEGGGQPSDVGAISVDGTVVNINYAEKVNNVVLHHIDGDVDLDNFVGKKVEGKIDWNRRITLARHHSATHLIVAAARKILGEHIWQAGAQKEYPDPV